MATSGVAGRFAFLLGTLLLLRPAPATRHPRGRVMEPSEACADFETTEADYRGSAWTRDDCVEVWERFRRSVPSGLQRRLPDVDLWGDTGVRLRQAGAPCLVASRPTSDGAGSSTIRHLATWIYAEQMGCDWVTPDWGKRRVAGQQGNGTEVMYCHRTATSQELDLSRPLEELRAVRRCAVVDWLSFFQFSVPSVDVPEGTTFEYIEPELRSTHGIYSALKGLQTRGISQARLVFTFHPTYASQLLLNAGSWDEQKGETVRRVLEEARSNFHRHPRPWHDESPECAFGRDSRLHFAAHVRMGDRREFHDGSKEYFRMLELIMDTISAEVVGRGLQTPLFHVFSETLAPCPSGEAGLFDEFPMWPVGVDKIPECLAAPTPKDCPEKRAGAFCSPARDGIFNVVGKDIVLHVGPDVTNALSCMIHADGVLMGCSTFGQVAGLLTKGISMFSMQCGGASTPDQYKSIPPLAVAERGRLWVPIGGSWRDPVMGSPALFGGALDTLLAERSLAV